MPAAFFDRGICEKQSFIEVEANAAGVPAEGGFL